MVIIVSDRISYRTNKTTRIKDGLSRNKRNDSPGRHNTYTHLTTELKIHKGNMTVIKEAHTVVPILWGLAFQVPLPAINCSPEADAPPPEVSSQGQ